MSTLFKRMTAIVVVSVMAASLFACGSQTVTPSDTTAAVAEKSAVTETTEAQKEPVTIQWFGGVPSKDLVNGIENDAVITEITKKTGVTIDFSMNMNIEDVNPKVSLLLASGDLPDVVQFGDGTIRAKVLAAKAAMPLDDLIKSNGSNLAENCKTMISLNKLLKSDDTHALYFLNPQVGLSDLGPNTCETAWNIRWDLYKKLNYPKLETLDDLLNVAKQMVELEPVNKDGKKNYALGMFGAESWANLMFDKGSANMKGIVVWGNYFAQQDMRTKEISARLSNPDTIYWDTMKLYNKAFQMGLYDPESATLKYQAFMDKATTGRYMAGQCHWLLGNVDAQFIADGTPEKGMVPVMINANTDSIYVATIQDGGNQVDTFISNKCKYPDRVMDVMDYLSTIEGCELTLNGIEGTQYDMVDNIPVVKEDVLAAMKSDVDYVKKTGVFKYRNLNFFSPNDDPKGYPTNFAQVPSLLDKSFSQVQKDFTSHYNYKTLTDAFKNVPEYSTSLSLLLAIQPEAGSELAAKLTKLNAYVETNGIKVIFQKSDADYEKEKTKFIQELKAMGADEVVKFYSDKYKEMKEKVASLK